MKSYPINYLKMKSLFLFLLFNLIKAQTIVDLVNMKNLVSKNCITYTEIDRWLFLSITIIILLIMLVVFLASLIVNKGQRNRLIDRRNFLDFDGFIVLAFYFPLCLAFCYLWRVVSIFSSNFF